MKPINNVLNELASSPKIIIRRRPTRSVNAPPRKLPMSDESEKSPNRMPTSVMPTLNFSVIYSAKKGNSSAPPNRSMKEAPTRIQNERRYSRYRLRMSRRRRLMNMRMLQLKMKRMPRL